MSDTTEFGNVTIVYALKELPEKNDTAKTNDKSKYSDILLSGIFNASISKEISEFQQVDFAERRKQEFYRQINRRLGGD